MKEILEKLLVQMQEEAANPSIEAAHSKADYLLHEVIETLMHGYDAPTQDLVKRILSTWESVSRYYS